ncbi:MAG TPA: SIS domain-containing protein [Candidatus Sulfotelmatobacter sp.]|nr:SIS domain-containing protein [Candidatus Sulfotelmatobacter sp.]
MSPPGRGSRPATFFEIVQSTLERVEATNRDAIAAAASIVADSIRRDHLVHAFGSGHSQLLAMDLAGRAGGFAPVQVIYDPGQGKAETLEGYAATLLRDYVFEAGDCLIVISNSGRNAAPIEMALLGRNAGLPVIAATSMDFSRSSASRHSSGKRLFELADVILDLCGAPGDAALTLDGLRIGPTSTVVGSALLHAVMAEAGARLIRSGIAPPVFLSQNVDGSREHNDRLRERYRGRIRNPV